MIKQGMFFFEGMWSSCKFPIFCPHADSTREQFDMLLFGLRFTILCDEDLVQPPPPPPPTSPLENTIVKCIN